MTATLDPIHAAAQTSQTRHPLCKILSVENVPAIPFNGELLSTATPNEQHPAARVHSTGRLVVAFAVDGTTDILRYGYTDTSRTFFTYVDLTLTLGCVCGEVAFCELADGNIGLIWEETYSGTRTIKYRKVTAVGVDLAPAVTGTILTNNTADFFTGPCVERMADDSYLMVYGVMDGTHYHLYRRTSADFVTWAAAAEIDTSGLTDENRKANPALIIEAGGDLWLLFDYLESTGPNGEELTNCYYISSTDKLATASGETALTTYADYSEVAEHPAATQKATGDIYFVFNRLMASLKLDKDTTGWTGADSPISNMHLNSATQKLYAVSTKMGAGNKTLFCVAKIDLATWTIDKSWDTTTVPAFPNYFATTSGSWWDSYHGEGDYVPIGHQNGIISVLDGNTDTITTYAFYDLSAYGIAKNVTWTPTASGTMTVEKVWVDLATSRLYVALVRTYFYDVCLQIGYIDLTASGPSYVFTTVASSIERGFDAQEPMVGFCNQHGWMEINPSAGYIIISMEGIARDYKGKLRIYDLTTGGLWKEYTVDSNPSFPYRGLKRGVYSGGIIAGGFTYEPLYGQADYRGLCIIDTVTDVITYTRPPWASVDNYQLGDIALTDDGEYLIAAGAYGVTLFDGTVWTLYSNTTVPGLTTTGENEFQNPVIYNPATDMIIAGSGSEYLTSNTGLIMFSRDGYIKQSNFRIGTDGSWGTVVPLVIGFTDYDAAVVVDPDDDGIYGFWVNKLGSELSIKWDKEQPSFDLTDYLVRGIPVERFSTIDPHEGGWDSGLSFSVTHGHLFDASNDASLLRQYLAKGRKVYQQFGDKVSGTEYWESALVFTVSDDGEIVYRRGDYPVMKVEAETSRRRWEQIHIIASEYYQTTPELLIADLLTTYAGIPGASISLGTWANSATVEYQFVDVNLADAINQVAIHFGYAIRIGASEIVEAVKITNVGTVARSYSDNTKLLNATPRNKNSSFINRWTVRCEERTFTELLMAEELAAEFNASQRWNTGKKEYRVDYTHGNKIYRNPRLEVVDSVEALAFDLAGSCSETLVDSSHDEADQALWDTYCVIEVDSPDLTPALIVAFTQIIGSFFLPDIVVAWGGGITIRTGSYVSTLWCFIALNILAATGNFQYRIHGQPVVKVRRTVQATADDLVLQVKMGQVISDQVFDDPLCESPADCQAVAEFRKVVGMGERARWSSEMVADLRNEDGDTLSVIHPSSGNAVTVYLTDLTTSYLMPQGQTDGGIVQTIEGWRV